MSLSAILFVFGWLVDYQPVELHILKAGNFWKLLRHIAFYSKNENKKPPSRIILRKKGLGTILLLFFWLTFHWNKELTVTILETILDLKTSEL